MNNMNPLAQYSKIEVLFTKLISNNVIKYEKSDVKNVKCGVCARSARDEIMLNTPDALIGGDAIAKVIENCVPNVLDANKLLVNDVEQLMIAIKIATKDESYDINVSCPKCEHLGGFSRDLNYLLQSAELLTEQPSVVLNSGLTVFLTPQTWEQYSEFGTRMFKEHSRSRMIDTENIDEDEKQKIFFEIFENMTKLNYDMICACIDRIVTPDDVTVTNPEYISEWLGSLSKADLKVLKEETDKVMDFGISHTMDVECSECHHEWEITGLRYDPSHFFGLDFSSANQKK